MVVRIILTLVLIALSYRETGIFTALSLFLIFCGMEIWGWLTKRAPDVCPECAGSGKTGSIGLPRECPYCDGAGKRR